MQGTCNRLLRQLAATAVRRQRLCRRKQVLLTKNYAAIAGFGK
jgi:hypothetical protein